MSSAFRARLAAVPLAPFASVLTLLVFLPFARLGVDAHHDGILLKPALDVASGQVLFRDTFSQYGALVTWAHAAALVLFGKTLLTLKVFTVVCYAIAAFFFTRVAEHYLPRAWVGMSLLLWIVFAPFYAPGWTLLPWASVPALVGQGIALWALLQAPATPTRRYAVVAGIAAAATLWMRLPVGILLSIAVLMALAYRRTFSALVASFSAMVLVHLLLIGILVTSGSYEAWIQQTIEWPARWAGEAGFDFRRIWHNLLVYESGSFRASRVKLYRVLSVGVFAFALLYPLRARRPRLWVSVVATLGVWIVEPQFFKTLEGWAVLIPVVVLVTTLNEMIRGRAYALVAGGIVATASWAQYYPIDCPRHLYWGLGPALGVFLALGARDFMQKRLVGLALLLAPLAIDQGFDAMIRFTTTDTPLRASVLRGLLELPDEAARLNQIDAHVKKGLERNPNAPFITDGGDALYATFVSNTKNYDRLTVEWGGLQAESPEQLWNKKAAFIREHRPIIHRQKYGSASAERYIREFGYEALEINPHPEEWGVILIPKP